MTILFFRRLSSSLPRLGAVFTAYVIWASASLFAAAIIADQKNPSSFPRASSIENPSGRKCPPRIYNTVRISEAPPTIDGQLDEPVWKEGEWAGDYTQQMPVEGAKPSAPTELKILYDDRNIYVAICAYDNPALVHRYPGRRDDFANPDFSFRQFCSNFVARWEYRPGSTLYFVWSQGRTSEEQRWDSSFSPNWNALWRRHPDNVIMVKLAYWLSP